MRNRLFCVALSLFSLVSWPSAAQPVVLRSIAQEANTLKFNPKSSELPGFSVELVEELAAVDPGMTFTGLETQYPTRRIEQVLQANGIDVFFGLIKTPERMKAMDYLEGPPMYTQYGQLAVAAADTVVVKTFDDIRDLGPNGAIGVPQGSAFVDFLKKQGGLIVDDGAVSVVATLQKLLAKRVRFVYFGGAVLNGYLKAEKLESQVTILPPHYNTEGVFVVVSKALNADVRQRLAGNLLKLEQNGFLNRLRCYE